MLRALGVLKQVFVDLAQRDRQRLFLQAGSTNGPTYSRIPSPSWFVSNR